jgi:hypothetical protein
MGNFVPTQYRWYGDIPALLIQFNNSYNIIIAIMIYINTRTSSSSDLTDQYLINNYWFVYTFEIQNPSYRKVTF